MGLDVCSIVISRVCAGFAAAKMVLQPGWSWSTCIKPVSGGECCQARYVGTVLSGSMSAKHEDGTTEIFVAGDVYVIEPGHDGGLKAMKSALH